MFSFFRRGAPFLLVLAMLTLHAGMAAAEEPDIAAAVAFAEKVENTSLKFVTDTRVSRAERAKRVGEVFARDFDMDAMARFALGVYWHSASKEQRIKYMELFRQSLVEQYTVRLEDFEGMTLKPVRAFARAGRDIIVSREAHHTDGMVVDMEWRIRAENGAYKIVDLTVMGISMGLTLRGEFAEIIRRGNGGVDTLLYALSKNSKTVLAQSVRG